MPAGRPSKLNPRTIEALEDALELCLPVKTACTLAGIGDTTYHRWIETGREEEQKARAKAGTDEDLEAPEGSFWAFRVRMALALERAHQNLVAGILAAHAGGKWQAGQWLLKCRYPELYDQDTLTIHHRHGGPEGEPLTIKHDLLDMSPAQLRALRGDVQGTNGGANGANGEDTDDTTEG